MSPEGFILSAGQESLPRQLATFAGFRQAMLEALAGPGMGALAGWRAREGEDLGLMLLEMGAYVFDVLAFYDEVIAHETYLRTARQRSSLRKLVGLLGYRPRPAVAASVRLAILAEGRQPLVLPRGMAFRSGGFGGQPPQVFELDEDFQVEPLASRWKLEPQPVSAHSADRQSLLARQGARLVPGERVLCLGAGGPRVARRVQAVTPERGEDGGQYLRVTLTDPTPGGAAPHPTSDAGPLRLLRPEQAAGLWTAQTNVHVTSTTLTLNTVYRQLHPGDDVLVTAGAQTAAFQVSSVTESSQSISVGSSTDSDGKPVFHTAEVPVTVLELSGTWPFGSVLPGKVVVHFGFSEVAHEASPLRSMVGVTDPLVLQAPVEKPGGEPSRVLVWDADGRGLAARASFDFRQRRISTFLPEGERPPLRVPVEVYGNVVDASRGETVPLEVLGSGNASVPYPSFKLQKKPLTWRVTKDGKLVSTLQVWVGGILWQEVSSFFGQGPDARVYVLRTDDAEQTFVTFGDGQHGARLPTGVDNVVASYRFGAGAASPPAGSVQQLVQPVPGVLAVKNPVAAAGGADALPASLIRQYGPRSALVLGRAVSIADMEAVAADSPGVRAVRADWDWSPGMQRAVVLIRYIGPEALRDAVRARVRGMCEPSTPVDAVPATASRAVLALELEVDPRYQTAPVLEEVRRVLAEPVEGLLSPERIGIGVPLYRSRLLAAVVAVEGVSKVTAVTWNDRPFSQFALSPGTGSYFDLEAQGDLLLNGRGRHG